METPIEIWVYQCHVDHRLGMVCIHTTGKKTGDDWGMVDKMIVLPMKFRLIWKKNS